jgi:microcystin-dependent protein
MIVADDGNIWVCYISGTPGSWRSPGAPAGTIEAFAGVSVPVGYLACDGTAYSRTTYAALYAIIGTTYGVGDGSTTFNVPDGRGKTMVATLASSPNFPTVGTTVGEESHLLGSAEMPVHSHGSTGNQSAYHGHQVNAATGASDGWLVARNSASTNATVPAGAGDKMNPINPAGIATAGVSADHTHAVGNAGGGGGHNNVQPSLVIGSFIIKF